MWYVESTKVKSFNISYNIKMEHSKNFIKVYNFKNITQGKTAEFNRFVVGGLRMGRLLLKDAKLLENYQTQRPYLLLFIPVEPIL